MKLARVTHNNATSYAIIEPKDETVTVLNTDSFVDALESIKDFAATSGPTMALSEVSIETPVVPTKVMAMGCAFLADSTHHFDPTVDKEPFFFLKPPSAVVGPHAAIEVPPAARGAIFESELAVVIGKRCKGVSEAEALDYVAGYTICNDMSASRIMNADGQWSRGKGLDTFCPIGPWIETEIEDPDDVHIGAQLERAGEKLDLVDDTTGHQIFSAARAIEYCSQYFTLEPGDIISLGCPPGPIPVKDGDIVRITLEGIGTLENPVVEI